MPELKLYGLATLETRKIKGDHTELIKFMDRYEEKLKDKIITTGYSKILIKNHCRLDL